MLLRIIILTTVLASVGCNYDIEKDSSSPRQGFGDEGDAGDLDPNLNYAFMLENIIPQNCFGCHNSDNQRGGLNLENYDEVFSERNSIFRAVESKFMPESKGRVMPDEEREIFLAWLAAGAPKESSTQTQP